GRGCAWEARGGEGQTAAHEDWKRRRGLVAQAGGHHFSIAFNRTDLSRGRLRLGPGWTQHHRSLHGYSSRHERVGCTRRTDPDFEVGRLRGKFALFGAAPGLQAYPPHGTRASRQGRSRSAVAIIDVYVVAAVYDWRSQSNLQATLRRS